MKYLNLFIILLLLSIKAMTQEININQKPEPLSEFEFKFPKYKVERLKNGLKVFLIEDKEQPTIAFRVLIKGGSSVDSEKSGIADLTSGLLTKGTKNYNADQIANTLDGVGASISASANADFISIYAQSLKKHEELLLKMLKEVILEPTFPKSEFEKLQKQTIASIQYEKSNPSTLAQSLSRIAIYGEEHPYAKRNTEESINSITRDDIINYYNKWFKSNNATIAVIGDFEEKEILQDLENSFSDWSKGELTYIELPNVKTLPKGVYFVSRPNSVQSSIVVTTLTVPIKNRYYETLGLASNIIGAFSGRLFMTLREKYSYTYTPFGFQTRTRAINRFACGADVAKDKTDSAISVILSELQSLTIDPPSDEEFNRIRQYSLGSYLMSMESSSFIASLIQNTDFYGLMIEELPKYPNRLQSMTPYDIRIVANEYINPKNAQIIVVGDPSIKESLTKFGQLFEYDLDLNKVDLKLERIKLTVEELLEKYIDAIGGINTINKINAIQSKATSEMNINGQVFSGDIYTIKTKDGRMYEKSDFRLFYSETWVDSNQAWINIQNTTTELKDKELYRILFDANIFPLLNFSKFNIKSNILGKNSKYTVLETINRNAEKNIYYFNNNNYLLAKKETIINRENLIELFTEIYEDYQKIDGILLPTKITNKSETMNSITYHNYVINPKFDENIFKPIK
jgi:predicted Zn-dependent peptidase